MKAIVTGGAGFIGSHIIDSLLSDGHDVVCVDNLLSGKKENVIHHIQNPKFVFANIDIRHRTKIDTYMDGTDVVFHNAASKKNICLEDPHRDLDINAGGTLTLLESALKYKVTKFIHASTGSVYGEPCIFPQTEDHPLNPVSYYGVSKLAGERYVAMYSNMGLDTTILRYFHVYGDRQDDSNYGGVVAIFKRKSKEGSPLVIYGDGTQIRSFTHVSDIVKINRLVATRPGINGEVYNCASGIKVSINELAGLFEAPVVYMDWLVGDIKKFDVDNSKVKALGISFETDISKGLQNEVSVSHKEV